MPAPTPSARRIAKFLSPMRDVERHHADESGQRHAERHGREKKDPR